MTLNLPWNGGKLPPYDGKLMCDFNPRKSRVKVTAIIYRSIFITQAPGVNLLNFFDVNLLTLFCKLDLFIKMPQILLIFMKLSGLQKSVSKFTLK